MNSHVASWRRFSCEQQLDSSAVEHNQRCVTDGMRSPWKLPLRGASKSFQKLITVAKKLENEVQPVNESTLHFICLWKLKCFSHAPVVGVVTPRQAPVWCCRTLAPVRKCTPASRTHVSCPFLTALWRSLRFQLVHAPWDLRQTHMITSWLKFDQKGSHTFTCCHYRSRRKKNHYNFCGFLSSVYCILVTYGLHRRNKITTTQMPLWDSPKKHSWQAAPAWSVFWLVRCPSGERHCDLQRRRGWTHCGRYFVLSV